MLFRKTGILFLIGCFAKESNPEPVAVVVVGGLGDLARKYLWKAFYNAQQLGDPHPIEKVVCAGRVGNEEGAQKLRSRLDEVLECRNVELAEDATPDEQDEAHERNCGGYLPFYHQVKKREQYKTLLSKLGDRNIVFYLSIPPFAFAQTAEWISEARLSNGRWIRVVFEKPFGNSHAEALELMSGIQKHLEPEEIFLIDHYLAKPTVNAMLEFRARNQAIFEDLWTDKGLDFAEVVMAETVDCEGRTGFYDEYGVISDTLQNHLTEILALLFIPTEAHGQGGDQISAAKAEFLDDIIPLGTRDVQFGQYETYESHAGKKTTTPTFAWGELTSLRFPDVGMVLISGKALNQRYSLARVSFDMGGEVVFWIGADPLSKSAILVSKSLLEGRGALVPPEGWLLLDDPSAAFPNIHEEWKSGKGFMFGEASIDDYEVVIPDKDEIAYHAVALHLLANRRQNFVDVRGLLASWKIWDHLTNEKTDYLYHNYAHGKHNPFSLEKEMSKNLEREQHDEDLTWEEFGTQTLTSGATWDTEAAIVEDITKLIVNEGDTVHIGLSGGSTPRALYMRLAHKMLALESEGVNAEIHIWQVDERCVKAGDSRRNSAMIQRTFLDHLPTDLMPHVHFMPVDAPCDEAMAEKYSRELSEHFGDEGGLDFLILGVGTDGHTASIFTAEQAEIEGFATLTQRPNEDKLQRMTMTMDFLSRALHTVILAFGPKKAAFVKEMGVGGETQFPVEIFMRKAGKDQVEFMIDKYLEEELQTLLEEIDDDEMQEIVEEIFNHEEL